MENNKNQQKENYIPSMQPQSAAKTAGFTYTVAAIVYFGVAFILSLALVGVLNPEDKMPDWALYANYLAAPVSFLLVGIWYFSYTKTSVGGFVKAQKCSAKYYLIAFLLQVGLFALGELNGLFLGFLKRFGYVDPGIDLPSMDGFGFVGVLLTIAVLPAIMEEFLFRGIFLQNTKDFSTLARVLICGGLFALYHQNPAQTMYQFVCGAAFALVAIKSGSFLPTALAHFLNNALILVLTKCGIESFAPTVYYPLLLLSGVCLVTTFVWLLAFDKAKEEEKKGGYAQFFVGAALGIVSLLLSWCATLLMGI